MNIIKMTSTHNTTAAKGRSIKYIAIHYTAGVTSRQGSARNTASWFTNAQAHGSADFIGWNADSGDAGMWRAFQARIGGASSTPAPVSTGGSDLLKKGSRGDTVRTMQQMLINAGYGCGATGADGIFGNNTFSALKSFQRDHGLAVDGIYGTKSKAALEAAYQSCNTSTDTIILRKGSRDEAVRTMQIMLTACGYDCGGADGIFGNRTLSALKSFQSDRGLVVDGIYGKNSRASLTQTYQATH